MLKTVKIGIPTDEEGFFTFQCSFCSEHFMLDSEEFQDDCVIEIFCPYCGLKDKTNGFLTDEIEEHMQQVAINMGNEILNDWAKGLEKQFKNNKNITFKTGKKLPVNEPKTLYEKENIMELVFFDCCNHKAKTKNMGIYGKLYCPYCGVK